MSEIDENLLHMAIEKWGKFLQIIVAIEELSELQKELCKNLRHEFKDTNLIEEEIADVIIMMEQLKVIYNKKNIDKWIVFKMKRLKNMLEDK